MRIDNKQQLDTLAAATNTSASQRVSQQSSTATTRTSGTGTDDQASLSSASNLVALAKTSTSAARQAKIASLTQQVQAGSYQGSTGQAGKAMVQELLQKSMTAA